MTAAAPTIPGEAPPAVVTSGLAKRYGKVVALDGVDLRVPKGAAYVLAGANGAGKTTLFEILLGLMRADAGRAEVFGLDVCRQGPEVRAHVGYVPAGTAWGYGWMTVSRLMRHHAVFYPSSWDDVYAARLARLFDLPLDRKFGTLSKGFARRVQLVLALAHRPSLLLLDEPTDGLDLVVRDELMGVLVEHLAKRPTTLLVSTHLVYEMEPIADYLGVLHEGRLRAQLPREALHQRLRRYRAVIPSGWQAPPELNGDVLQREGSAREIQWVVWGEQDDVVACLTRSGASVQEDHPLTLPSAVLALLRANLT